MSIKQSSKSLIAKPGRKPEGKIRVKWSSNFAYAIGLIVTDGCLYNTGRHIAFTSKDCEQIENFLKCLNINSKIGKKAPGAGREKKYFFVQIGDVLFYKFLNTLGITSAKSKTLEKIDIPDEYFFDFLRGVFDGDGYTYSYWDKRWKSSFMFYLGFCSAAPVYLRWLREEIFKKTGAQGHVTSSVNSSCLQLKYSKKEAIRVLEKMYYSHEVVCLSRKKLKINQTLCIMGEPQILTCR